jgi:hypothetical protein
VPCSPDVPIACSLDQSAAERQLDEWAAVLGAAVTSSERTDPTTLRMRIDVASDVGRIVDLARREVACCPFFGFAIEIDTAGIALVVSVPSDAVPILDAFASVTVSR